MDIDAQSSKTNALDQIAQIFWRIVDSIITAQEADKLTSEMSCLIWAVSDPDVPADRTASSNGLLEVDHQDWPKNVSAPHPSEL
jgi:hypothetical protein